MAKKKNQLCSWKQAIYFPVYPAVNRGQIRINSIVSAKNTYTPKTHCWWSALNLSEIECRKKHQVISACQSGLSGISIMPSVTGDFRLESSKSVTGDSKFKSRRPLLSSAHHAASKSLSVFRRFRWSIWLVCHFLFWGHNRNFKLNFNLILNYSELALRIWVKTFSQDNSGNSVSVWC